MEAGAEELDVRGALSIRVSMRIRMSVSGSASLVFNFVRVEVEVEGLATGVDAGVRPSGSDYPNGRAVEASGKSRFQLTLARPPFRLYLPSTKTSPIVRYSATVTDTFDFITAVIIIVISIAIVIAINEQTIVFTSTINPSTNPTANRGNTAGDSGASHR